MPWKLRNSHLRRALHVIVVPLLFVSLFHLPVTAQVTAAATHPPATAYQPISGNERIRWAVKATVGPQSLAAGVWSAGWGTAMNTPPEYGTHWGGFAKRYGMRLTGVSTGNAIEASLGTLWNEDPRYFQSPDRKFMGRVRHATDLTFRARRADGELHPAFARYVGNVGNNFLSNTWRVESESSVESALTRTFVGFAGKFASNLFEEFWPSVRDKIKGN